MPPHNILIITSRRAKVEETLKDMGVLITERLTQNGNLNFEVWQTENTDRLNMKNISKKLKVIPSGEIFRMH